MSKRHPHKFKHHLDHDGDNRPLRNDTVPSQHASSQQCNDVNHGFDACQHQQTSSTGHRYCINVNEQRKQHHGNPVKTASNHYVSLIHDDSSLASEKMNDARMTEGVGTVPHTTLDVPPMNPPTRLPNEHSSNDAILKGVKVTELSLESEDEIENNVENNENMIDMEDNIEKESNDVKTHPLSSMKEDLITPLPIDSDDEMDKPDVEKKDVHVHDSYSSFSSSNKVNHLLSLLSEKLDWIKEEINALKPKYSIYREEVILEDDRMHDHTLIAIIRIPIFIQIKNKKAGPWIIKIGIPFGHPDVKPTVLHVSWKGKSLSSSFIENIKSKVNYAWRHLDSLANMVQDLYHMLMELAVPVDTEDAIDMRVIDYGYDLTEGAHWGNWTTHMENPNDAYDHPIQEMNRKNEPPFTDKAEAKKATALYSFIPKYEGELPLQADDRLVVLEETTKGWLLVHKDHSPHQLGYVPENYVQMDESGSFHSTHYSNI